MPDVTMISEKEWNERNRCLCCWATDVAATGPQGVVLHRIGAVIENLMDDLGHDMETLDLRRDDTPSGLSVWEGDVEPEGEDEFRLRGSFRSLTVAEWSCVRENVSPWAVEGSPEETSSKDNCLHCPNHDVILDPDPDDWFNDDDVAVVCHMLRNPDMDPNSRYHSRRQKWRCVTTNCRPTKHAIAEGSTIPPWCPLKPENKDKS